MVVGILSCIVGTAYILLISFYTWAWKRTPAFDSEQQEGLPAGAEIDLSVIIPFRDEASNIERLLTSLKEQHWPPANVEIILVDDHSTDHSQMLVEEWLSNNVLPNACVHRAVGEGKKNALSEGIEQSSGKLIICTDADCRPHPEWVRTMFDFYKRYQPNMIIAPVTMTTGDGCFFGQLQALEFFSLQASAAGAACADKPIMCNGANIAFTRQVWENNKQCLKHEKLSGDDMFLMMSLKRKQGKIFYLKSDKAVVYTAPSTGIKAFFNQRKRWVSKSSSYTDKNIIGVGLLVFFFSLLIVVNFFLSLFLSADFWLPLTILFVAKLLIDSYLLYSYARFFNNAGLVKWMPLLSLIYPFYVVATAVTGLFGCFEWKGRKEQSFGVN